MTANADSPAGPVRAGLLYWYARLWLHPAPGWDGLEAADRLVSSVLNLDGHDRPAALAYALWCLLAYLLALLEDDPTRPVRAGGPAAVTPAAGAGLGHPSKRRHR